MQVYKKQVLLTFPDDDAIFKVQDRALVALVNTSAAMMPPTIYLDRMSG